MQKDEGKLRPLLKEIPPGLDNDLVHCLEFHRSRKLICGKIEENLYLLFRNMKIRSSPDRLVKDTSEFSLDGTIAWIERG